jgi:demethylmenaquinone methyltransferase/2-methoxy-6-polyprenyl-1,4-benzoquinol methylase
MMTAGPESLPMVEPPPRGSAATEADESRRRRFLRDIFDQTASHYDRIDGLLSFGLGRHYRADALRRGGLAAGMLALDVAVGTGAVSAAACGIVGPRGRVIGVDPSPGMLRQARAALAMPLLQGMAEALPFRAQAFDFLSMGYALRHVTTLEAAFREYARVLRPGGKLLLLEFRRPETRLGLALARVYMGRVVPAFSRLLTWSRPSEVLMRFCWQTVEDSLPPATIIQALQQNGFRDVTQRSFFGFLIEYRAARS